MKEYDDVKVIKMRERYKDDGIELGDIGYICLPEIRDNTFYVLFEADEKHPKDRWSDIYVGDLEVVKNSDITDEGLKDELSCTDIRWWCKVEDGYIMNLEGKRKNKIPYDYES